MKTSLTIAEMLDRGIELTSADAVAIAQSLLCAPVIDAAEAPGGPLSLENVSIDASGAVRCAHAAATPSVAETALVLQSLIRRVTDRVQGGIRYAVGRALLEVEAPPYETLEEFSSALARFESDDRATRLASLYARATVGSVSESKPDQTTDGPADDRRRGRPTATELRRDLREADLRLYEAHQQARTAVTPKRSRRSGPIAACMVAGVALVAAGELTHARRPAERAVPVAQPLTSTIAAAPSTSPITPIDSTIAQQQMSAPANDDDVTSAKPVVPAASPQASRPPQRSRDRSIRIANASASSEHRRARTAARADARRTAPARSDRGVIARIRFEWNNPFR